jgi:pimeloyl-ACP methyl ester carboxylesterase
MAAVRNRLIGLAAAGTAAAVAGVIAERRVGRRRRAVLRETSELGSLSGEARPVVARDGLVLHAEVDEVAPYSGGREPAPQPTGRATLVFVHGFTNNLHTWHFQRQHFRGKRRMVFFDHRSHGRSERSSRDAATMDQLALDLLTVMDELAPNDRVVLIGHSMGGMAIMALAELHPELFGPRVVGVGLCSTSAGGVALHKTFGLPGPIGAQVPGRAVALAARAPALVDRARRAGSNIGYVTVGALAFGTRVPGAYVELVDQMIASTPFEVISEFLPNIQAHERSHALAALASVPTHIFGGTRDRMIPVSHSRTLHELIAGSVIVEYENGGHMVPLEFHEQLNEALDELCAQADSA